MIVAHRMVVSRVKGFFAQTSIGISTCQPDDAVGRDEVLPGYPLQVFGGRRLASVRQLSMT